MNAVQRQIAELEQVVEQMEADPFLWLIMLFDEYFTSPFSYYQMEFWEWLWAIEPNTPASTYFGIWPRGGAKSTSAELAVVALGARSIRKYGLYICETQEQADDHVGNIGTMLESKAVEQYYPDLASRMVGKYGSAKGWRRNRLRTRSGFTVDAIGLDTAARGVKLDKDRPDFMVIDDIDSEDDSPETTSKKIDALTKKLLPAGNPKSLAVLAIQNLVHEDSIFSKVAKNEADFLRNRIVSGPIPAVEGLEVEQQKDGKWKIVGGEATWEGMNLEDCQELMDKIGLSAFLSECQHDTTPTGGGMFDHLEYLHCNYDEINHKLFRKVCWVDPAVTKTDRSDSHAISICGMDLDGKVYDIWSWERRATPLESLKLALLKAKEYDCEKVGIETDQGGDTWVSVYHEAQKATGIDNIPMDHAKAGGHIGGKTHRASQMLADYERGNVIHCYGTHATTETALNRFPRRKPFDLVDAKFWSWFDLVTMGPPEGIIEDDDRVSISAY